MTYIPKSLVNNNLYTSGGEYINPQGKPYEGFYHELFNGQVYSGKTPLDPNKTLLKKPIQSSTGVPNNVPQDALNQQYISLNPQDQEIYEYGKDPETYFPILNSQDYKRGQIIRYFAKKRNQSPALIREIDKATYDDIIVQGGEYNYVLWSVIKLFWKVTGPLYDSKNQYGILQSGIVNTNERLRDSANQDMKGIKQYLSNLIQLSIKPDIELISGQYTGGGDFTVKQDNSDYTGYYHIMADGTIMDGATHEQSNNIVLLAGNVLVQNRITTLLKEELGKLGAA